MLSWGTLHSMNIEEHFETAPLTTFKIGGKAAYLARVQSVAELKEALTWAKEKDVRTFVLGGGSNVVMPDGDFDRLVLKIEIEGIEERVKDDSVLLISGAGESWDRLVEYSVERGLYGIENLSSIPGTVGASPIQNIGAYGSEVKDTIEWVEALDIRTQEIRLFANEECQFGYRNSFFKSPEGKNYIVTRVAFRLSKNGKCVTSYKDVVRYMEEKGIEAPTLSQQRNAIIEIRSKKFPDLSKIGTAGSFFKNPIIAKEKYEALLKEYPDMPSYPVDELNVKVPFAWILDTIFKVKGTYEGPIGFFEKQPLVVVNMGGGTQEQIKDLTQKIIDRANEELGISIEREVTLVTSA